MVTLTLTKKEAVLLQRLVGHHVFGTETKVVDLLHDKLCDVLESYDIDWADTVPFKMAVDRPGAWVNYGDIMKGL